MTCQESGADFLADAEQALGFLNARRIADKLQGQTAVSFLQNNSQTFELVAAEPPPNIRFRLPDSFQLEKARPEIRLNMHHEGANEEQAGCLFR